MNTPSDRKKVVLDGVEYRYSSDWIHRLESETHWRSYWHQLNLVLDALEEGDTILEIGPGSGFVTNYLRSKGYKVTTLDIDERKAPDVVANIVAYDFPGSYDHILAFEVFEHIPYDKFTEVLHKLSRSIRKNLFFSVPLNYRIWYHADMIIPYFKEISFTLRTKRRKILADNHFWELGYRNFTTRKLSRDFEKAGFSLKKRSGFRLMVFFQLAPAKNPNSQS